jgi:serine/threonine protein kinase/tetratricopeptide (TPR) repeat protein
VLARGDLRPLRLRDEGAIGHEDHKDREPTSHTVDEAAERRARRRLVRSTLPKGSFLGRYQIIDELGQGGMGVVYRAHDADLGRDVAVKLVTIGESPTDTLATRLMREAQALAQLSHPNVVAVYDVGRVDGGVFVAMELIAGESADLWLRHQPPWREVVSVFRDAARGLAAAHRVGLVHRDFKPANLMIGADGRVRVLDFGLARAASGISSLADAAALSDEADTWHGPLETSATPALATAAEPWTVENKRPSRPSADEAAARSESPAEPSPRTPTERSSSAISPAPSLLDTPLTQTGAIIGTPPYMAPEQHLGAGCDARTDQFSFCVAFYQALYGARPFVGNNYAELSSNIIKGKIAPAPATSDVPGWVRAIVLSGLEVVPEKRWPSMDAIIEALGRDPAVRRQRRLRIGGGAALFAVVGVAGGVTWRNLAGPGCGGAERALAGVWDPARKQAVRAAFARTGLPYAEDAFAAATRALDAYAGAWVAMHVDACEAERVRHTQSAELFDLRMECLAQRLDEVRAKVELFTAADGPVVARAAEVARSLTPLDECADAAALRAPVRPPAAPDTRARVEATRKALATVRALWEGGRYADAQKLLSPTLAQARASGWRPLEATALLASARLRDSTGDYAGAARDYRDAAVAAEAGRADEDAARAQNGLVWVTGERLGKYAEAHELLREAQAKVERLGRHDLLQADLDAKVAALSLEEGKYPEALTRSQRVLETRQKVLRGDDPALASALSDVADVLSAMGRYDEAIADYRRALGQAERAVGVEHPMCGTLRVNLGTALRARGRNDEALAEYRRALAIIERADGRDHPTVATISVNLAGVLLDEGRPAEAAPELERALAIWQAALGPDHPNVATVRFRLGQLALQQNRPAEASADFTRALAIWRAKLGPEHPSLMAALDGLGDARLAEGKPAEAEAHYREALAIGEKALGPTHADLGDALTGIGLAALAAGAPRRALPPLERAAALRGSGSDPIDAARTRFALARALVAADGDRGRALALARAARAALAAAGRGQARALAEVDRWLEPR